VLAHRPAQQHRAPAERHEMRRPLADLSISGPRIARRREGAIVNNRYAAPSLARWRDGEEERAGQRTVTIVSPPS